MEWFHLLLRFSLIFALICHLNIYTVTALETWALHKIAEFMFMPYWCCFDLGRGGGFLGTLCRTPNRPDCGLVTPLGSPRHQADKLIFFAIDLTSVCNELLRASAEHVPQAWTGLSTIWSWRRGGMALTVHLRYMMHIYHISCFALGSTTSLLENNRLVWWVISSQLKKLGHLKKLKANYSPETRSLWNGERSFTNC